MENYINSNFDNISECFIKLKTFSPIICEIALECAKAIKNGNKIMFCGNGGSASDSQHLAAELVGKYKLDRKSFNAIALTTNSSILTAVINDYGFDTVFERQIEGLGKSGDILFCLSTSGQSKNVINALKKAQNMGIKTVALTGSKDNELIKTADFKIQVPSEVTNRIQEMHIAIGHLICDLIEKELTK